MPGSNFDIRATDGSGVFQGYLALPGSGKGPGLVLLQEIFGVNQNIRTIADRYAEEGYVVLAPDVFWRQEPGLQTGYSPEERQKGLALMARLDEATTLADIQATITTLRHHPAVTGKVGVVGFCMGGKLAFLSACRTDADAAIGYYGVGIENYLSETIRCPLVLHIAQEDGMVPPAARQQIQAGFSGNALVSIFVYPGAEHAFARIGGHNFHKPSVLLAQDRTLTALKSVMGPHYDLATLWEKHLAHFYQNFFVNTNPPDTSLIPISRTVGATQVVDEMLFCFTHTCEVPWMLPGIPATGKRVEIPLVAVVKFRGGKLCHEHIYWDQASVLVQIGLLNPAGLPVAGLATARKLLDENLPSNTLMDKS